MVYRQGVCLGMSEFQSEVSFQFLDLECFRQYFSFILGRERQNVKKNMVGCATEGFIQNLYCSSVTYSETLNSILTGWCKKTAFQDAFEWLCFKEC